ncbi:MAG: T9SS type A sorting domain-containing protein [Bacteroidales bacterium]|nr:T9SS type A sorting domain-containing protein [Bacteroidales bacterium]MCF8404033.1 T9SS type A sorting domain-containing protein [Bacteroidales bacterium]
MKKRFLPLGFFSFLLLLIASVFALSYIPKENEKPTLVKNDAQSIEGAKQYLASIRNNQHTGLLNPQDVLKAREQKSNLAYTKSGKAASYNWLELGPDNMGGRTRALIFDNRDPSGKTIYAGSVNGGIFKSTDVGANWTKVNMGSGTANLNVSSMVQTADGTIYVGTGEGFNTQNYTGTGFFGYEGGFVGKGIFKSDNNDDFYLVAGTQPLMSGETADWAYVNDIAIDVTGNRLFAATQNGLNYASLPALDNWQSEFKYSMDSTIVNRQISIDSVILCDSFSIVEGNFVIHGSLGWQTNVTINDTVNQEVIYQEYLPFETYGNCYDVKVSPEGWIITSFNNKIYVSESGDPNKMVNKSVYPSNPESIRKDNIDWTAHIVIKNKSGVVILDSVSQSSEVYTWHSDYYYDDFSGFKGYPKSIDGGRTEFAIAPSNGNIVYAMIAKGTSPNANRLEGIFLSENGGQSWRLVAPGASSSLNILGSYYGANLAYYQGDFSNTLAVFPNNPYRILAGGINMWMGTKVNETGYFDWAKVSVSESYLLFNGIYDQQYCHMDHHTYVFRPGYNNQFIAGTDGGMFYATASPTLVNFQSINKNYNVTQFYSLDISTRPMEYIGGTQDNGTVYNSGNSSSGKTAEDIWRFANLSSIYPTGTDGGSVAFSNFRKVLPGIEEFAPPSFYSKSRYPDAAEGLDTRMRRSETLGFDFSNNFLDGDMTNNAFITPMLLWESYNDPNSRDSIQYFATEDLAAGDTIMVRSNIYDHPFIYFLPDNLEDGDSMMIQDIFSTKLFIATKDEIWMTKESHRFDLNPEWWVISDFQHNGFEGVPVGMGVSADGNVLYVGNDEGGLYKISNIALAYNQARADVNSSECIISSTMIELYEGITQAITSISVDPKDANKVLVTLGNYGNADYVYYSTNALSDNPVFTSVQGNLPGMPVYSSLLEMGEDTDMALLGTEMGVWASDDPATGIWYEAAEEIGDVPVMALKQQSSYKGSFTLTFFDPATGSPYWEIFPETENYGDIYAATHGRGVFRVDVEEYVGIKEQKYAEKHNNIQLSVYPNPASDIAIIEVQLSSRMDIQVNVFDLAGKLVISEKYTSIDQNNNKIPVKIQGLNEGTYLIQVVSGNKVGINKIVVVK